MDQVEPAVAVAGGVAGEVRADPVGPGERRRRPLGPALAVPITMHRLTLTLSNPSLERAFLAEYRRRSMPVIRFSLLLGFVIFGVFGVLDESFLPTTHATATVIRYLIVCPSALLVFALSYHPRLAPWTPHMAMLTGLLAGLGLIAIVLVAPPPGSYLYSPGVWLVCFYLYTFFRLRFIQATPVAWLLVLLFEAGLIWGSDTPAEIITSHTFFLVSACVIGMSVCYSMEWFARSEFLDKLTIDDRTRQLRVALREAELARLAAEEMARLDPLTGLYNRRYFLGLAEEAVTQSVAEAGPLSLLMIDIDRFKPINDRYGHPTGDRVLAQVAASLLTVTRLRDVVCRYGGEEFLVLLPDTDQHDAGLIAERIRAAVQATTTLVDATPISVTVSVGVATLPPRDTTGLDRLIEAADVALYRAKGAGRNRVVLAQPAVLS